MNFFQVVSAIHTRLYRATGGKLGGSMKGQTIILLTTTGNKTGVARTVPVMSFEDRGDWIVVGSKGGSPDHPAWYKNLAKKPEVTVELRADKFQARAETVAPDERARLWKYITETMPQFAEYEKKATQREIPVVRLKRM